MAKKDNSTFIIGGAILLGAYVISQNNSGGSNANSGSNSSGISATGNYTQNGTVDVPGVGVLPASQQTNGIVYVLYNGHWILMSVLQGYYNQAVANNSGGSSSGGFGNWLSNNSGNLIGILEGILNGTNTNAGDILLDLGSLLPRGVDTFRPL